MSGESPDPQTVFAQYIQRVVQGSKGSVVTFSSSTVVKMWAKWFGYGQTDDGLIHKVSRLLSHLASCGLLKKHGLYKYQLMRGTKLWDLAKHGVVLDFLKNLNCYSLYAEEFNAPWTRRDY